MGGKEQPQDWFRLGSQKNHLKKFYLGVFRADAKTVDILQKHYLPVCNVEYANSIFHQVQKDENQADNAEFPDSGSELIFEDDKEDE
ncbi:hypothetical protein FQR65_LT03792 [Abscondita terminalis]|nr:hypothetical protein FQR65_LT03792 [Abscondita terminalis]